MDDMNETTRPLFIINDMINPTVSFRSHSIHEVYHMFQEALERIGHLQYFHFHPRGEDHTNNNQCRGLDGYSFFGLNLSYVINTIESQENSVYHAIPPSGEVAYNYHQITPKSDLIIRVQNERVIDFD